MSEPAFRGCKLALIHDGALLVYTRDRKPDIVFPGMIDFPGGGREGEETPEECVLRELHEEFGIRLAQERLVYRQRYEIPDSGGFAWFFGGRLFAEEIRNIRFGDEGSHWQLIAIEEFLEHPEGISHLKARLRDCLDAIVGE